MDELLSDFLNDAAESLEIVEADILRLEAKPGDGAILNNALRQLHTIKGAGGFMALPRLTALAEAGEEFLIALRERGASLKPGQADAILRCVDRMKGVCAGIEAAGAEPLGDDSGLIAELHAPSANRVAPAYQRAALEAPPRMLRINAEALDALADMAAELARTREALLALAGADAPPVTAIAKTADEMIALVDHLRRRPASECWRPLTRVAREAATALGKQAEIVFAGEDVELDAAIVEAMKAPLIHLLRNAVAHGLESPAVRAAANKAPAGRIGVSVRIEKNGETIFEISDDGAGLDPVLIRKRGIENGMLTAAQAARLSDSETIDLLFAPGFSTAPQVNALAGRGIGLDAVRASVARLSGVLEAEGAPGLGATFRIRIPGAPAAAPLMILDPAEPAHERLSPLLSAAGYDIEHQTASALPDVAAPVISSKEQSA